LQLRAKRLGRAKKKRSDLLERFLEAIEFVEAISSL
jgi:hypothetical protein